MFEVTLLALLQGVAEFLPISSSGHLVIAQHLLGTGGAGMRLDVFLHVGTLVSIALFYRREIGRIIARREWLHVSKILLSTLPAMAVYFLGRSFIESAFEDARMVGGLLVFTGLVISFTRFLPQGGRSVTLPRALAMGAAQALALLPGVSRSGMTLAAARLCKVDAAASAEFSFLMSAPLIAGAAILEIVKATGASGGFFAPGEVSWALTAYGAALAALVGYYSLKLLVMTLKGRSFWLFGPYCVVAGILTFVFCGG
jgi:undecaprenyl-diphosphatase